MGQFSATLRVPGDNNALPATVDIDDGRLRVESGSHVIGNWALGEIDITQGPEGVHVSAEGEVLILEISESEAFHEAAGTNGGKPAPKANSPFKLPNLSRTAKHADKPARRRSPGPGLTQGREQPRCQRLRLRTAPKAEGQGADLHRSLAGGCREGRGSASAELGLLPRRCGRGPRGTGHRHPVPHPGLHPAHDRRHHPPGAGRGDHAGPRPGSPDAQGKGDFRSSA